MFKEDRIKQLRVIQGTIDMYREIIPDIANGIPYENITDALWATCYGSCQSIDELIFNIENEDEDEIDFEGYEFHMKEDEYSDKQFGLYKDY